MAKIKVEITETYQKQVIVEARNDKEAEVKVRDMYLNADIVLEIDDFIDMTIKAEVERIEKIERIGYIDTSYADGSKWFNYKCSKGYGYDYVAENCKHFEEILESENYNARMIKKPHISSLSKYLSSIIKEVSRCESDMLFIEEDDEDLLKEINNNPNFINSLKREIEKFSLDKCILFDENECAITVYGSIITNVLF